MFMLNLKAKIINKGKKIEQYSRDASIFCMKPEAIIIPADAHEVAEAVKNINILNAKAHDNENDTNKFKKYSLTPRAAGTCMSGGPLSENLIMSFTEHMHNHSDIHHKLSFEKSKGQDKYYIDVEPGLYHRDLEKYIDEYNLMFASYPASKDLCAMGGIVNNNSGGEKTLKYGKTENYLREIEMVCSDGNIYKFHKVMGDELDALLNINNDDYYAKIHRDIYHLLKNNWKTILKNKPRVSKNSAGYYLWNVYNESERSLDLSQLFCGAQGTLGIMTKAKLELVKKPQYSRMITLYLSHIDPLADLVRELRQYNPESLELYDDHTFKIAMKYLPNMISKMSGNIFSLALSFWPEVKLILTGGVPKVIIIAEFTDTDEENLNTIINKAYVSINTFILKHRLQVQTSITQNQKEAEKYWLFRRESFNLLRSKLTNLRTVPFIDDVVVSSEYFPRFMPEFERILDRHELLYTIAGHAGDGNLHVIPLMKLKDDKVIESLKTISDEVYTLVQKYNGSITGEHNDGLIHAPFLNYMYDDNMLDLFRQVKNILDPNNIFNPHKKIDVNWNQIVKYIDRRI